MTVDNYSIIFSVEMMAKNMQQMGKDITENMDKKFKNVNKTINKLRKSIEDTTKGATKGFQSAGAKAKAFNVAMLSTLFFAKYMSTVLFGLLEPAAQAFGWLDLWNDALTVGMLPIFEKLSPYFYDLMVWFMDLPEPLQLAIGAIILFGASLFKIVEIFAIFSLFGKALGVSSLATLGWAGLIVIALVAVVAVIYLIWKNWDWLVLKFKNGVQWIRYMMAGLVSWLIKPFKFISDMLVKYLGADKDNLFSVLAEETDRVMKDAKDAIEKNNMDYEFKQKEKEMEKATKESGKNMVSTTEQTQFSMADIQKRYENMRLKNTTDFTNNTIAQMDRVQQKYASLEAAYSSLGISIYKNGTYNKGTESEFTVSDAPRLTVIGNKAYQGSVYKGPIGGSGDATGGFSHISGASMSMGNFNDFVFRPGQGAAKFSPNDTLIGVKDPSILGGKGMNISINYNINVSDKAEMMRMIDYNNKKIVDDVKRMVKL